jgi:hypothetical protein
MSLSLESPASVHLDPSDLVGDWRNSDWGLWGGIARMRIRQEGPVVKVEGYGVGKPEDHAWGEAGATLYSALTPSPKAYGFNAVFDFGFLITDVSAYHHNGILVITTYNVFRDGSGRSSYWTREFFHPDEGSGWPGGRARPAGGAREMGLSRERDRPGFGWRPSNAPMGTGTLLGTWVAYDRTSRGITRAVVAPQGEGLLLSVGEAGRPELRAWPEVAAVPLAASVEDRDAMGFIARVDPVGPSDPRRAALYGYVNRGLLTIVAHVVVPAGSGEVNTMARAHYYRPEAPG